MSFSFNKIIIGGNLVKDPDLKTLDSGKSVCNFTLAINDPFNKEEVTFLRVVAWNKTAEICAQFLSKGSSALVEGRLVVREYKDKEGNKQKSYEVVAGAVQFVGGKREGGGVPSVNVDNELEPDQEIPF